MERVTFLIEQTNERIACLLNPESLEIKRIAGVRKRSLQERPITGAKQSDTPLQFTGGGQTVFQFDLLFDLSVAGSTIEATNIRKLTAPLWDLSENKYNNNGSAYLPIVRFIWGKSWNVPGVITAIAERLEAFSPGGEPGRSWLRMRMLRISDQQALEESQKQSLEFRNQDSGSSILPSDNQLSPMNYSSYVNKASSGAGEKEEKEDIYGGRHDLAAYAQYGDSFRWREVLDKVTG